MTMTKKARKMTRLLVSRAQKEMGVRKMLARRHERRVNNHLLRMGQEEFIPIKLTEWDVL